MGITPTPLVLPDFALHPPMTKFADFAPSPKIYFLALMYVHNHTHKCPTRNTPRHSLRCGGLGVAEGIFQGLIGGDGLLDYAPAVVVVAEANSGAVVDSVIVERLAYLIDGNPAPGEVDVGVVSGFADAVDAEQFAERDLDLDGPNVAAGADSRQRAGNQGTDRIHAERGEHHVPARRRIYTRGTLLLGADDPSATLQDEGVGRTEVLVGDDAGAEPEGLRGFESGGGGDQVGGQAAGEEIARRTGRSQAQEDSQQQCF